MTRRATPGLASNRHVKRKWMNLPFVHQKHTSLRDGKGWGGTIYKSLVSSTASALMVGWVKAVMEEGAEG